MCSGTSPHPAVAMHSSLLLLVVLVFALFIECSSTPGTGEEPASDSDSTTITITVGSADDDHINAQKNHHEEHINTEHVTEVSRALSENDWDRIAEAVVSELKPKLDYDICLPGLRVETNKGKKSLLLSSGKLIGLENLYHKNDVRVLSNVQGETVFEMILKIKNLRLEYYYEYVSSPFFYVRKKEGSAKFHLKGVTSVSVVVVYKWKESTGSHVVEQLCSLNIRKLEIKQMGHALKVVNVRSSYITRTLYFFMKYLSPTVRGVTAMVKALECDIKKQVEQAVEEVLGIAINGLTTVCSVEQSWTPKNCNDINDLGTWE